MLLLVVVARADELYSMLGLPVPSAWTLQHMLPESLL